MTVSRSIGMFEYKVRQHCFFMHLSILWFIYIYMLKPFLKPDHVILPGIHSSRHVKPQPKISESCQFSLSLNRDQWLHPTVRRMQVRQILLGKVRGKGALPEVSITDNLQTVPRAALHSFIKTETVAGPAYCNTPCVASMQRMMLGIRLWETLVTTITSLFWNDNPAEQYEMAFLPFYVHKLTLS